MRLVCDMIQNIVTRLFLLGKETIKNVSKYWKTKHLGFVYRFICPNCGKYTHDKMSPTSSLNNPHCDKIDEYWIVDWQKKRVEIYNLDYDENKEPQYYLWDIITEDNKEKLKIVHFPL